MNSAVESFFLPRGNLWKQRRTKIVCTIGPSTSSEKMLEKLVRAGMDCARLNFSHGTPEEQLQVIKLVRKISERTGKQIAVLQDLPGPKFRVGVMEGGSVQIKKGSMLTLTSRKIKGTENIIPLRSGELPHYVTVGGLIFLSDGAIRLKVLDTTGADIKCKCEIGGVLLSGKGVNVPLLRRGFEAFTRKDKQFLAFGLKHGIDFVAVSFVRRASDVESVRNFVRKNGGNARIIAKIEKREAVDHIGDIVKVSDGIMVARGDLGVENPIEQVPELQKQIISASNSRGIPVITATQMLESMVNNPRPTRAEVTDVANAIFDGTDAVMLSEETAVGKFPVQCVRTLDDVSLLAEERMRSIKKSVRFDLGFESDVTEMISSAVAAISIRIKAEAIVMKLDPFDMVSSISRLRPNAPIVAVSDEERSTRRSKITWGVYPFRALKTNPAQNILRSVVDKLVQEKLLSRKEKLILISETQEPSGRPAVSLQVVQPAMRRSAA